MSLWCGRNGTRSIPQRVIGLRPGGPNPGSMVSHFEPLTIEFLSHLVCVRD